MTEDEKFFKKWDMKEMAGLNTDYEEGLMLDWFEDFVNNTDWDEWNREVAEYDKKMRKQLVSKYGIIPDTFDGMFMLLDVIVNEFDNHKDEIDFKGDSLFGYCISTIWCFCMKNDFPEDDYGNEYKNMLHKLHYEPCNNYLEKAWDLIKNKIAVAKKERTRERLLMVSLGLSAFLRRCEKSLPT